MNIFIILIGSALVNNYVLSQFLGICPFLGVSKKTETALGMGIAVIFVMALASAATYIVNQAILIKDGPVFNGIDLTYLQTIAFILIIAALVQLVEMFIKKSSPTLYQALGVFLPLITTNCAVLGVTIVNIDNEFNFIESVLNGVSAAVGFTIAIVLFAGIRERVAKNNIPTAFQGFPIALLTAGLMAIAFLGFSGLLA